MINNIQTKKIINWQGDAYKKKLMSANLALLCSNHLEVINFFINLDYFFIHFFRSDYILFV